MADGISSDLIRMPYTDSADYSVRDVAVTPINTCDACGERVSSWEGHALTECLQAIRAMITSQTKG